MDLSASLEDVLVTAELARRSTRSPDYAAEGRALTALAEAIAESPQTILQKLVETALDLCHAGSAGISLLEGGGKTGLFRWHAVAGRVASSVGSLVLREASPSGIVLDRNTSLLFSYPERHFDYGMAIDQPVVESLLVPFHNEGKPIGTLWVMAHTPSRRFDAEDQRILTNLSHFASLAVRAREDLRQILDGAAIALAHIGRDQRYLACNRAYEKVLGRSSEEIIGRRMVDVMGAEGFEVIRPYIERVLLGERVEFDVEVPISGEPRFYHVVDEPLFDSEGHVTSWIASVSDVTDLKQATESLRASQERLRLAISSGTIGVWDWDVIRGRSAWSPELYELYGVDPGTPVVYEDFRARVHPDDLAEMESQRDTAIRNHKQFDLEFRIVRPSGEIRWLSTRGRGYYDESDRLVRVVGNNIDITERVQAKEALREAQERLQRWNVELEQAVHLKTAELIQSERRLRSLTMELNLAEQRERQRLAAELHDHLQQMLVLGKLKLGQGGRLSDPASARIMKETENLLSDALTYTHSLVAELSPPVLRHDGLAAGLKWLSTYMKKYDIAVAVTVRPGEEPKLPDDQVMLLFQSVRELLINSSKYAGTGRAEVSFEDADGRLVITVRDEGKGFSLAAAAAADSPSPSVSSKFGLFSIRERMRALGGSFEIESSPGKGTTATLILPLSNARVAMTDHSELEAEPNPRESKEDSAVGTRSSRLQRNVKIRVLLVDDHVMVRQGLRTVLESYSDIEVVGEAGDGREAIELAERLTPEVIVMDINMPNMNGIEATVSIKSRHSNVKIIALSVNADAGFEGTMLRAGAESLVSKEAALDELYRAIRQAL